MASESVKVLLTGDSGTGKTALLIRYTEGDFTSKFLSTVGIDFKEKKWTRDGETETISIWDTAGQERYRSISTAYYRGAEGFIIVFDLTSKESFQAVEEWYRSAKEISGTDPKIVLVGNKSDLTDERAVTKEEIQSLVEQLGIQYFETSVKDGVNVDEVFDALMNEIKPPPEPVPEIPPAEEPLAVETEPEVQTMDVEKPSKCDHVHLTAEPQTQDQDRCGC